MTQTGDDDVSKQIEDQLQQDEQTREKNEQADPNRFRVDISGDTGVEHRGNFPDLERQQEDENRLVPHEDNNQADTGDNSQDNSGDNSGNDSEDNSGGSDQDN